MQKIQILFPDPVMHRLRRLAEDEDRPVSELVRRAVERFLDQSPGAGRKEQRPARFPTFKGGAILATAAEMKELLHDHHE